MSGLTERQQHALRVLNRNRGVGLDADELARSLDTSPQGAARTMSSLVRKGYADRFVGGVGRQRVHWQASDRKGENDHG